MRTRGSSMRTRGSSMRTRGSSMRTRGSSYVCVLTQETTFPTPETAFLAPEIALLHWNLFESDTCVCSVLTRCCNQITSAFNSIFIMGHKLGWPCQCCLKQQTEWPRLVLHSLSGVWRTTPRIPPFFVWPYAPGSRRVCPFAPISWSIHREGGRRCPESL